MPISPTDIRTACERHGVEVPANAADAEALATATADLKAKVATATRPDPATITAANVAEIVEALVDFDTAQAVRIATVEQIDKQAQSAVEPAWRANAVQLCAAFGEVFNRRAGDFLAAVRDDDDVILDPVRAVGSSDTAKRHRDAMAAAADLDDLRRVRDGIAGWFAPTGILPTTLETWGRVLEIGDTVTLLRRLPISIEDHPGTAAWWARAARLPGVTIKWHCPTEQIEMAARCTKAKAAA